MAYEGPKIEGAGSGYTTKENMATLREHLTKAYKAQLEGMGRGFSKKTRGDLEAGFQDGMACILRELAGMNIIAIVDGTPKASG